MRKYRLFYVLKKKSEFSGMLKSRILYLVIPGNLAFHNSTNLIQRLLCPFSQSFLCIFFTGDLLHYWRRSDLWDWNSHSVLDLL